MDTENKLTAGCIGASVLYLIGSIIVTLIIIGVAIWAVIAVVKEYTGKN